MFVCSISVPVSLNAQRVLDASQSPWRIDWKQIETDHYIIMFPGTISDDARRIADYMENIYPHITKTIGGKEGKTTIILNTTLSETNGYASFAPTKSEWFNDPGQDAFAGSLGWYELLGIHEYRHILQFESLKKKTTYILSVVFGEELSGFISQYVTPGWFYEGDAVLTETLLSNAGRGRTPEFDAELRAQLLSGRRYGYYKAVNGSYGDYDPLKSPYLLGYFMVSHIRKNTYGNVFEKINERASWVPLPYLYNAAVRKYTGKNISDNYENTMNELTDIWSKRNSHLDITASNPLVSETLGRYRKYTYPMEADEGTYIAFRSGMDVNTGIVIINAKNGEEEMLERTYPRDSIINVNAGKIVWAESVPHLRWGMESYSDVYLMDLKKDSISQVTFNRKISAPSLSPDASRIIAVEIGENNICCMVCIDARTGRDIYIRKFPKNEFVRTPRFSTDGKNIVYSVTDRYKGVSIKVCDSEGRNEKTIVNNTYDSLSSFSMNEEYIFFVSSFSGIDNVYAFNLKSKKMYQVTSRPFGAYMPSISSDNKRIIFSDVTADGYIPSEVRIEPDKWVPVEKVKVEKITYCDSLVSQESDASIVREYPSKDHEVEDYPAFESMFNFHSWYVVPNTVQKDISATFISTNVLSTLNATAGYTYNYNEKTNSGNASISYAGIVPIINVSGILGQRTSTYSYKKSKDSDEEIRFYSWNEKTVMGTIHIPLNFSQGLFYTTFDFGSDIRYTDINDLHRLKKNTNNNGKFIPLSYWATFYNLSTEFGYVLPKWGQVLNLSYSHTPFSNDDYNVNFLSADGYLYLPGFVKKNNLYFEGAYEAHSDSEYHFDSKILFARGYDSEFFPRLYKGSMNYTFPVYYPDRNVFWVFYAKRIYVNLFGDICVGKYNNNYYKYRSAGSELMLEFNPFNIPYFSIHMGYRYAHKFDKQDDKNERNYNGLLILISAAQ